ncbi:MAG: [acyl-carrier-protein] S-malonyltransferase [Paraglaciecola sp.]|jgi:[acyl-carrier-protein] S-malonyltransferase
MTKLAWVFPGQGSQSVGMLADLAGKYPLVQETFALASQTLGYDLWDLVQNDAQQQLGQTHITQPALLTSSYAIYKVLRGSGIADPDFFAGHSLGEYSALLCAGVIEFDEALTLVEARGQFMQQAVPAGVGAMYAIIGLNDADVIASCEQAENKTKQIVSAVNFNSPGQIVIAGNAEAAALAAELCKEAGAKRALPLSVSVPSHCALMKPAAQQLADMLTKMKFNAPRIPIINNVDVAMQTDPELIKRALVEQLYSPVRWTETIQRLSALGVQDVYEVGPGKVLTGLIKRIDKSMSCEAINSVGSVESII